MNRVVSKEDTPTEQGQPIVKRKSVWGSGVDKKFMKEDEGNDSYDFKGRHSDEIGQPVLAIRLRKSGLGKKRENTLKEGKEKW